jgi:hypothetical protein
MNALAGLLLTVLATVVATDEPRPDTGTVSGAAPAPPVDARADTTGAVVLDEITIEGEIDVPRVLFISARDHLRRIEPMTRFYLIDPIALGHRAPRLGRLAIPTVTPRPDEEQPQQER